MMGQLDHGFAGRLRMGRFVHMRDDEPQRLDRADRRRSPQRLVPFRIAFAHRHDLLEQLELLTGRALIGQGRNANQRRPRQRPMVGVLVALGQFDKPRGDRRIGPIAHGTQAGIVTRRVAIRDCHFDFQKRGGSSDAPQRGQQGDSLVGGQAIDRS